MKIIIVTNEYTSEGGGLSYSCRQFHKMLLSLGHDVTIHSSALSKASFLHCGYDTHLNEELMREQNLKEAIIILPKSDIIIAFGGCVNAYYASLLAKKKKVRFWLMFRGSDGNLCKWNIEKIYFNRFAVENAEMIFALSQEIADNIALLGQNKKVIVIPNYAIQHIEVVKPFSPNVVIIGTGAAHLNEKKGVRILIEMVANYNKRYNDKCITLELVGAVDSDILKQYITLINELDIYNSIHFLGNMTHSEFLEKEKSWDMYVQASACEGMGNSVIDSMSWGVPVMLSETGYVAEFFRIAFPKILFTSFDPSKMAEELHSILSSDSIENTYTRSYCDFFKMVSESKIKSLWNKFLSYNKGISLSQLPQGILSLSLHDVAGEIHDSITTPVAVFKQFVNNVATSGFRLCSMQDYIKLTSEDRLHSIVCTFDDAYKSLLEYVMPILDSFGFSATTFVCCSYMGKNNDWNYKDKVVRCHLDVEGLQKLQQHGWEIGSHGVTHRSILRLNDDDLNEELQTSQKILETHFGPVRSYAYPYGDYSEYTMKQVGLFYDYAFLLTNGGVYLEVDYLRIHRYYLSEINQILKFKV